METPKELTVSPKDGSFSLTGFDHAQRVAKMLCSSDLIPKNYQGNIQNTMIALEMANRIGASPLMVMQNLYIVHGKPSWSSTFIIAAINSCKKFSPLRFEMSGEGENMACYAWAYDLDNKEKLIGPTVTMKMAKAEGWIDKSGSKWKTIPDLMIRYRSAAFFGRLYAPEIMMGMHTMEEVVDIQAVPVEENKESQRILLMISDAKTVEDLAAIEEHLQDEHWDAFNEKMIELKGNTK